MGCGRKTPFTPYERSLLGRFCGRTSHNDNPYISPFVEDMVLFFRFLSNIETRVSCSSNPSFLGFHTQAVFLTILGCGFYFELFSGCALMVLFVAAVCFLAWHPTTPHHMLSSHAGRYYARILSDRQFEYLSFCGRYGVVSSFIVLSDARLLFSGFRFMFLSCTLMLPDRSMGCGCHHPSPYTTSPSWDGFMREFRPWDDSNIFRRYCVVYVSLERLGHASPLVRFEFRFHGIFSVAWVR